MIILKKTKFIYLKIEEVYYCSDYKKYKSNADIIIFIQSVNGTEKSKKFNTLHLNLEYNMSEIFSNFNKRVRNACRQAERELVTCSINFNPNNDEISCFCEYYNIFAKEKCLNPADFSKFVLLRNAGALCFSEAKLNNKTLCYHVYNYNNQRARLLYSASHYMLEKDSLTKNIIGRANRLLIWNDIKMFKENHMLIYDFGGISLTNKYLKNIDDFKNGFGGELMTEHSFYYPNSILGNILMKIFKKKI